MARLFVALLVVLVASAASSSEQLTQKEQVKIANDMKYCTKNLSSVDASNCQQGVALLLADEEHPASAVQVPGLMWACLSTKSTISKSEADAAQSCLQKRLTN